MHRTRRTVGIFVATTLLASALTALSGAPAGATGSGSGSMVAAVNAARASAGRRPLSNRSDLAAVAYQWSLHMAATSTLQHNPSLTSQVSGFRWVGENVGYGPSWSAVETAFMNSPHHRSNILDSDYTQIGVGIVVRNGRVWVTQVFKSPFGATTTTTVRKRTVSKPAARTSSVSRAATRPKPAVRPKPAPTPAQLLASRITSAEAASRSHPAGDDPLVSALGFTDAMRTVGG
ncbi:MAG: hypothetical protein QOJ90_2415 [Actinomycetota bacterium]|nr:hypothetical protein [Actinomycetota bacterium]